MPMSPSRFLVWKLRRRREAEGLTQEAWGQRCFFSGTHVSSVERGTRPVKLDYLEAVDKVFGTAYVAYYENFIKSEHAPVWLRPWLEYEERAAAIRLYQPLVIPGLFQTEAYARMVLSCGPLQADEVERRVQVRLGRQLVLDRENPPRVAAVIEEMMLRRGDSAVMPEQLEHLIALAQRPNVTIRVIPLNAPAHLGWGGPVEIASFDDGEDAGHLDNVLEGQTLSAAAHLTELHAVWDAVSAVALPAQQSLDLIKEALKSWT